MHELDEDPGQRPSTGRPIDGFHQLHQLAAVSLNTQDGLGISGKADPYLTRAIGFEAFALASLVNGSMPIIVATVRITPLASLVNVGLVVDKDPVHSGHRVLLWLVVSHQDSSPSQG